MQHTARHTPAADLQTVIDHWTHMRALVDTSTPPTDRADYLRRLDQHDRHEAAVAMEHAQHLVTHIDEYGRPQYECLHCDYVGEGRAHLPRADRDALQLGERPVPLRLHVVDACRAVEVALCSLADEIAAEVQLPPVASSIARRTAYRSEREARIGAADRARRDRLAAEDTASPHRWSYVMGDRSAVRAAAWLLARLDDGFGYCKPISSTQRARIGLVAREAARRVERTIGNSVDRYSVLMDRPCPYCGGGLTMYAGGGEDDAVTCSGPGCDAPVGLVRRRRTWSTPAQLAALQRELDAAARRRKRAEARARQRAAARARHGAAA